jgi:hypothetical protein
VPITRQVNQAFGDRTAIYKLLDRMTPAERQMLPEDVASTVDGLYHRASELARTLQAMDSNVATQDLGRIRERIAALSREPDDEERARRLALLERQEKAIRDLGGRRDQIAGQFESCCLAMQNVRSICCGSVRPMRQRHLAISRWRHSRHGRFHATWTMRLWRRARFGRLR